MKSLFSILVFALFFIFGIVVSVSAQTGECATVVTPEVIQFELYFQKRLKEKTTPFSLYACYAVIDSAFVTSGWLTERELNTALEKLNQDYEPAGIPTTK